MTVFIVNYLSDYLAILSTVYYNCNMGMSNNSQSVDLTTSIRIYHLIIHSVTVYVKKKTTTLKLHKYRKID